MNYRFKTFYLQRTHDVSGISGCGVVAHGIELRNNWVVLEWIANEHESMGIYPSVEEMMSIHSHGGATQLVWIEDSE